MPKFKIYSLKNKNITQMPLGEISPLIKNSITSSLIRKIILSQYSSKFAGFILQNDKISKFLIWTKIVQKIFPKTVETYKKNNCQNLNSAFHFRNKRNLTEKNNSNIFSSPVDAYLNIREIKNEKIELFPEIILDLKKMIGKKYLPIFSNGGKMLLFTLKPFHDHTIDYPIKSKVLESPKEINKKHKKVYSTDLHFLDFLSKKFNLNVFEENHRVITPLEAVDFQEKYLLIEVGATNVNSIKQDNCQKNQIYERGVQKSHFNFGSTVILLLPNNFSQKIKFNETFKQDLYTSVEVERRDVLGELKK